MPPHGNRTNMGLTEPEADTHKSAIRARNVQIGKKKEQKRLNCLDSQAQTGCMTPRETGHLTL